MKITDRLKVEHGVFLAQLRHLEQMVAVRAPAPALAGAIETIARAEAHHSALDIPVVGSSSSDTLQYGDIVNIIRTQAAQFLG